jgi:transcriptional regulator of acetoin/glycerol metabolism
VLERAALLSEEGTIHSADLALSAATGSLPQAAAAPWELTLEQLERQHIVSIFKHENGLVDQAALRLGIPRSTLYTRLKQYGITLDRVRTVGTDVQ